MTIPITLAANSTSWDERRNRLIPRGQGDRYLSPILAHLPETAVIARQPRPRSVNFYMNHRGRYRPECWHGEHASIQGSHGIADKGYRDASACSDFNHVVAPGPALAESIIRSGVPPSKVHQLGYPKLDPIHRGEITSPWPERDGRIRVLWAPTHGGGSEAHAKGNRDAPGAGATTWWHRDALLALLDPEQFLVWEAPHPRHSAGRRATLEQYVGTDVVLADGGSTMYEAWCVGIPVVFADWISAERNLNRAQGVLLERRVYRQQLGWHAAAPGEFAAAVEQAARSGISRAEQEFAEEVLPAAVRGHGGNLHAEFLLDLASKPAHRPPPIRSAEVPVRFASHKYRNLTAEQGRVRFTGAGMPQFATVTSPNLIALLQRPYWQKRGVRIATDDDLVAVRERDRPAAPEPSVDATVATDPESVEVPAGSVGDVLAWVGDDPDRARQALEVEQARAKPRATLVGKLEAVAAVTPVAVGAEAADHDA